MTRRNTARLPFGDDNLWYKDAIIYELHVRAFFDSDANGVGDFAGLIEKLDYLEDLGVNALWLLPFYPSPLKDDGYDISDYDSVLPAYGTMDDFKLFVDEAHRHGMRVITELVINHTSDQHPWFQRARTSPPGSRWHNFYVWSNTAEKYKEARIIFKDYESSNWAWDTLAKAYYWHRFYLHQPDLNFESASVRQAVFRVMDHWLRLGVDGLRVDAVPYLFEREGTNCENLPETHAFLRELRAHVDKKFRNRMLLAEANQWPEDAAAYFGSGDEFHMAFHFPIMPRLFMAIHMEDRFPIIDIVNQTPPIQETSQWAIFLRNHDELTLEMVTDEERDYMYRVYAQDPTARINLGIRRRLAPLLSNDRRKIELMNALLFSLPGTPVIYYGDEIGMGDNFYLGDRNGVRTPMQWSPERNAGFSHANPQRLYLPPITDPEYNYEAVNVETQQGNTDSLLWWMKRMISLRKHTKAFGRGNLEFLQSDNRKVLCFLRSYEEEIILVVASLSHLPQQTQVNLSRFTGWRLVDLFGRVEFAPISDSKYYFTLSPYAFYCFSLQSQPTETLRGRALPSEQVRTVPLLAIGRNELFEGENRSVMATVLQDYVTGRRWFRSRTRIMRSSRIVDVIAMPLSHSNAHLAMIQFEYTEGEQETYALPLASVEMANTDESVKQYPHAVVARMTPHNGSSEWLLCDALFDKDFCLELLEAMRRGRRFTGQGSELIAWSTGALGDAYPSEDVLFEPTPIKTEQTNTSVTFGDRLILKLFRRADEGINPELEIGRFLMEETPFTHVSQVAGALEYRRGKRGSISLAVLHSFVPNEGDAWNYTLDSLERYFQKVVAHPTVQVPPVPRRPLLSLLRDPPPLARETVGPYLTGAQLLGQRTGELHVALASASHDPAFVPEPFSPMYRTSLYQSMRSYTVRMLQLLREQLGILPDELSESVRRVLDLENEVIERYRLVRDKKIAATRIRCHGDYHLGQVLYTGKDFVIIDFEGEPARPLSERRLKRSPLRDVAGMLRSFHYAAQSALRRQLELANRPEDDLPMLQNWAQHWYVWVSVAFLTSYLEVVKPANLLPEDPEHLGILLDAYLLDKAVYEIGYELNNRPNWLNVPLEGILNLMESVS
jgi:maltose alpha-D-glucosyltransferase/alpha-amylase